MLYVVASSMQPDSRIRRHLDDYNIHARLNSSAASMTGPAPSIALDGWEVYRDASLLSHGSFQSFPWVADLTFEINVSVKIMNSRISKISVAS